MQIFQYCHNLHFKFWKKCTFKIRNVFFRKRIWDTQLRKEHCPDNWDIAWKHIYIQGWTTLIHHRTIRRSLLSTDYYLCFRSSKFILSLHRCVWQSLKISQWFPIWFCSFQCKSHKMLSKTRNNYIWAAMWLRKGKVSVNIRWSWQKLI